MGNSHTVYWKHPNTDDDKFLQIMFYRHSSSSNTTSLMRNDKICLGRVRSRILQKWRQAEQINELFKSGLLERKHIWNMQNPKVQERSTSELNAPVCSVSVIKDAQRSLLAPWIGWFCIPVQQITANQGVISFKL